MRGKGTPLLGRPNPSSLLLLCTYKISVNLSKLFFNWEDVAEPQSEGMVCDCVRKTNLEQTRKIPQTQNAIYMASRYVNPQLNQSIE